MGMPDHLTYFLRNLYAGQEGTVSTGHGTTDLFKTGKGVHQDCISSPYLFNIFTEYIIGNSGLDSQVGIKFARRNINNIRYADTTLMAESEEELKSLLKLKEESEKKVGWKLSQSIQLLSLVWLFVTPWTVAHQASLSITNPWSLLRLLSIESVMPSNHIILCHFPSSPTFNLSQHWSFLMSQFFASGGRSIGVSASASVLPMNIQDWFL